MKAKQLVNSFFLLALHVPLAFFVTTTFFFAWLTIGNRVFHGTPVGIVLQSVYDLACILFIPNKYFPDPILGCVWLLVGFCVLLLAIAAVLIERPNETKRLVAVWSFWIFVLSLLVYSTPGRHFTQTDIIRVLDETVPGEPFSVVLDRIPERMLERSQHTWKIDPEEFDSIRQIPNGIFLADNVGPPTKALTLIAEENASSRVCGYLFGNTSSFIADLFFSPTGLYCGVRVSTYSSSWMSSNYEPICQWVPMWKDQCAADNEARKNR